jgi:hypothetical protein
LSRLGIGRAAGGEEHDGFPLAPVDARCPASWFVVMPGPVETRGLVPTSPPPRPPAGGAGWTGWLASRGCEELLPLLLSLFGVERKVESENFAPILALSVEKILHPIG